MMAMLLTPQPHDRAVLLQLERTVDVLNERVAEIELGPEPECDCNCHEFTTDELDGQVDELQKDVDRAHAEINKLREQLLELADIVTRHMLQVSHG